MPTLHEQGMRDFDVTSWFGLFAPAGTPVTALRPIEAEALRALAVPEIRAKLEGAGLVVTGREASIFRRTIEGDTRKWAEIVRASGFKATGG